MPPPVFIDICSDDEEKHQQPSQPAIQPSPQSLQVPPQPTQPSQPSQPSQPTQSPKPPPSPPHSNPATTAITSPPSVQTNGPRKAKSAEPPSQASQSTIQTRSSSLPSSLPSAPVPAPPQEKQPPEVANATPLSKDSFSSTSSYGETFRAQQAAATPTKTSTKTPTTPAHALALAQPSETNELNATKQPAQQDHKSAPTPRPQPTFPEAVDLTRSPSPPTTPSAKRKARPASSQTQPLKRKKLTGPSATTSTAAAQPPQKTSNPSAASIKPRTRPWTATQIASLANTLQASFNFDEFASANGKTRQDVFDVFSAVVQMPLLGYSEKGIERARRGERMKEFRAVVRDYKVEKRGIGKSSARSDRRRAKREEKEGRGAKEEEGEDGKSKPRRRQGVLDGALGGLPNGVQS